MNPHLHNVPMQIAAERGLPALAHLAVVHRRRCAATCVDALRTSAAHDAAGRRRSRRWSAMLAAGLFEYNFGDSEFLMLFLLLVTLPFAAPRAPHRR